MGDNQLLAIADAAIAALKARSVADGRLFHIYPTDAAMQSKGAVALGIERATPGSSVIGGGITDWEVTLRVDCYSHFGVNNPRPHEAVTLLYGDVFAALMPADSLMSAGLPAEILGAGPALWNYTDDERQLAVVSSTFRAVVRTGNFNLAIPN